MEYNNFNNSTPNKNLLDPRPGSLAKQSELVTQTDKVRYSDVHLLTAPGSLFTGVLKPKAKKKPIVF